MQIKRIGSQPFAEGPADWFTGTVRIDALFAAPSPARLAGADGGPIEEIHLYRTC